MALIAGPREGWRSSGILGIYIYIIFPLLAVKYRFGYNFEREPEEASYDLHWEALMGNDFDIPTYLRSRCGRQVDIGAGDAEHWTGVPRNRNGLGFQLPCYLSSGMGGVVKGA